MVTCWSQSALSTFARRTTCQSPRTRRRPPLPPKARLHATMLARASCVSLALLRRDRALRLQFLQAKRLDAVRPRLVNGPRKGCRLQRAGPRGRRVEEEKLGPCKIPWCASCRRTTSPSRNRQRRGRRKSSRACGSRCVLPSNKPSRKCLPPWVGREQPQVPIMELQGEVRAVCNRPHRCR